MASIVIACSTLRMDVTRIPPGRNPPDEINVLVEIPQGGVPVKYELDKASGALFVNRFLHTAMYYPAAFDDAGLAALSEIFPELIEAKDEDAEVLGLNAVSDGRHVVLSAAAEGLASQLVSRGFEPIGVDMSELLKGGGGPKCCTLELRP